MKFVELIHRLNTRLRPGPVTDGHNGGGDTTGISAVAYASLADKRDNGPCAGAELNSVSLEELSVIARNLLLDKDLEVSKIRPFFWTMVEVYVERFQIFPFDAVKALYNYLELHGYPKQQLRELIVQLEMLYQKQHGEYARENGLRPAKGAMLDEEIKELRETLKYAAIAAERIEGYE